eukprot:4307198-Pyramimonas_sp.AAC.1
MSFSRLRESWEAALSTKLRTWRSVGGPAMAMRKSFERFQWGMSDFCTLVTDQGGEVSLTLQSPGTLKAVLREAVFRRLEGDIGSKVGFRKRACFDV